MNKLFLIVIAIFTLQINAQKPSNQEKKNHKKEFFKDLSAAQIANLKTKKMTLYLDLTKAQQNKVYNINLISAKERKIKSQERENNNIKPNSNERYQHKMAKLDKQIAYKKEMQSILNKEQFEKWKKMKMHRMSKQKKHKRKVKRKK